MKFSSETAQITTWTNDSLYLPFKRITIGGAPGRAVEVTSSRLADTRHRCNQVSATTLAMNSKLLETKLKPETTSFKGASVFGSRILFRRQEPHKDHRCCPPYAWGTTTQTDTCPSCHYHHRLSTSSAHYCGRAKMSAPPQNRATKCTSHRHPGCSLVRILQQVK